ARPAHRAAEHRGGVRRIPRHAELTPAVRSFYGGWIGGASDALRARAWFADAMDEILIAYATKHGSTHEVAEAIAGRLAEAGGAIVPETLHFPFSNMPAGDLRDWAAIEEWAARLPDALGLDVLV